VTQFHIFLFIASCAHHSIYRTRTTIRRCRTLRRHGSIPTIPAASIEPFSALPLDPFTLEADCGTRIPLDDRIFSLNYDACALHYNAYLQDVVDLKTSPVYRCEDRIVPRCCAGRDDDDVPVILAIDFLRHRPAINRFEDILAYQDYDFDSPRHRSEDRNALRHYAGHGDDDVPIIPAIDLLRHRPAINKFEEILAYQENDSNSETSPAVPLLQTSECDVPALDNAHQAPVTLKRSPAVRRCAEKEGTARQQRQVKGVRSVTRKPQDVSRLAGKVQSMFSRLRRKLLRNAP